MAPFSVYRSAVPWNWIVLPDDARARRVRRVDLQVGVRERRPGVGQPEQAGELLVRPHRDQVAAGVDPVRERRHLRGGERRLAEHDDVEVVSSAGEMSDDVERGERVQALVAQDLAEVGGERIRVEPTTSTAAATTPS